jgi:tetratricopeptide (TPR) repeat protein
MARNVLLPVAIALVVSLTVVLATRPGEEPPPAAPRAADDRRPAPRTPRDEAPTMLAPGPAAAATLPADADEALRELSERVDRLEARIEAMSTDVGRIEEEVSGPDPRTLDDEKLLAHATSLYGRKDYEESYRYWKELLDRDLSPEDRARALQSIGFVCRMTDRQEESERHFRALVAHHGENTPDGMFALYHVAWSRRQQEDIVGARDLMLRVSTTPHTADIWKLWSRANAADFTIQLGETGRARMMLQSLKADLAEDTSATTLRVRSYVDQLLSQLDG